MAFNSKALALKFVTFLLLCGSVTATESELTLAEQREKSLENRYRRILGLAHRGDLQARADQLEVLNEAKIKWDQQRVALGLKPYHFDEPKLVQSVIDSEFALTPINVVPFNSAVAMGHIQSTDLPSEWIKIKLKALEDFIVLPKSDFEILSSTKIISLSAPAVLKDWKFWSYDTLSDDWRLIKTGYGADPFQVTTQSGQKNSYAFTTTLSHPSKAKERYDYQIEVDLLAPECEKMVWQQSEDGLQALSWSFEDAHLAGSQISIVIESEAKSDSKVLVQQNKSDSIYIEPHKARWVKGVSFLVYDLAGHKRQFHFSIRR